MRIELGGRTVWLEGDRNPIAQAALAALLANGGKLSAEPDTASILLLSWPLLPGPARAGHEDLFDIARRVAGRMALNEGDESCSCCRQSPDCRCAVTRIFRVRWQRR